MGMGLRPLQNQLVFDAYLEQYPVITAINKIILWMMHGSIFRLGWDRLCHVILFKIERSYLDLVLFDMYSCSIQFGSGEYK